MTIDFKLCEKCGKPFMPNKAWQKYCSGFCNRAAYYARRSPPSVLDDPITGPSAAQEAENERRRNLKPDDTPPPGRTAEVLKALDELGLNEESPLSDLGYGKEK